MTNLGYGDTAQTVLATTSLSRDVHSYSEPDKIRVRHIDLDLRVRFEERTLEGIAVLDLECNQESSATRLILDSRDLQIYSVEVASPSGVLQPTNYALGPRDAILGAPLTITLSENAAKVRISYRTATNASGLQWLEPSQTAGKQSPFLYTQSQEIHARSWIPLQDTPEVRVTYSARVHVPGGLLAVMSADSNPQAATEGCYEFRMSHPVPSYLIALAVGDLSFTSTGSRTGVYGEHEVVESAAHEFAEAENMVEAAEDLYGPYLWGRFDILILPPSFPFGGMENPGLIFATPTLIAGDRSSVSVIAHELAHAWSGNLVTNATWSDFWLNEGFTTYIEYRIQERLYGKSRSEVEQVLAQQRLAEEMANLEPRDQVLHIDLDGRDPDCGATLVPYVKGALFLKSLERTFGRPRFDNFLKDYFSHFRFQSITTEEAVNYLRQNLLRRYPAVTVSENFLSEWINKPGLPDSPPTATSELLDKIGEQAKDWSAGTLCHSRTRAWTAHEWLYFLRMLPSELGAERMKELDDAFHLTETRNAEILHQWLLMAIRNSYKPACDRLERFLSAVGRRIYIKPLYEELVKTEAGKQFAQAIYGRVRSSYHPISQAAIDKIVGVS